MNRECIEVGCRQGIPPSGTSRVGHSLMREPIRDVPEGGIPWRHPGGALTARYSLLHWVDTREAPHGKR